MTFRPGVRLDPTQMQDMRGKTSVTIGGRQLRRRGNTVGGVSVALPIMRPTLSSPVGSPVRRGIRNDHTPAGRQTIRKVAGVRLREAFSRPKPMTNRSMAPRPTIMANAVPRPGDLRSAAISLSRGRIPQGSLLGNIIDAIRQPIIRTTATTGATDNLAGNIRQQLTALSRKRLASRQGANVRLASDNYNYGARQTGRLLARRRGTPTGSGLPTRRPR